MGMLLKSIGSAVLVIFFLWIAWVYFQSLTTNTAVAATYLSGNTLGNVSLALFFAMLAIIPAVVSIYYARKYAEEGYGFKAVLKVPFIILGIVAVLLVGLIIYVSLICSGESCMGVVMLLIFGPLITIGCWIFACLLPAVFVKYTVGKEHLIARAFLIMAVLAVLMLVHLFVIYTTCNFSKDINCLVQQAEAKNDMSICEKALPLVVYHEFKDGKEVCYSMIAYNIPQCRSRFSCNQLPEKYRPQCEPYYKGCPIPGQ